MLLSRCGGGKGIPLELGLETRATTARALTSLSIKAPYLAGPDRGRVRNLGVWRRKLRILFRRTFVIAAP